MKVLLIDPPGWQKGALNSGLAYLSAALSRAGFEIKVIDANNFSIPDNELIQLVVEYNPDAIGFSVKSATVFSVSKISQRLKNKCRGALLIAGGIHISLYHEEFLRENNQFDYLFLGDAEASLADFLKKIERNEAGLSGLQRTEPPDNLDALDFPSYDFFYPQPEGLLLREKYPLVTSRGCTFKCIFCVVPLATCGRWRARTPKNVIEELKYAKNKYRIKRFEIIDDNFTFDAKRAKQICAMLINEHVNLAWSCPNGIRAKSFDEELAGLMKESGCDEVCVGVESADKGVFASLNKGLTLRDIEESIAVLKKAGMRVKGFFIIGLPGDSLKKLDESLAFIKKTGLDGADFGFFLPYPQTAGYEWVQTNGRMLRDYKEGAHFGAESMKPVFETDDFSEKERVQAFRKARAVME